jgi:multiple sugar transport system permease protein
MDGWRWGGRFFLLFMLLYTAVPMVWMLLTSSPASRLWRFRRSGGRASQRWQATEAARPQNSVGKDFRLSSGTACSFRS